MSCFIIDDGVLGLHIWFLMLHEANLPKSLKWKDLARYKSKDGIPQLDEATSNLVRKFFCMLDRKHNLLDVDTNDEDEDSGEPSTRKKQKAKPTKKPTVAKVIFVDVDNEEEDVEEEDVEEDDKDDDAQEENDEDQVDGDEEIEDGEAKPHHPPPAKRSTKA